MNDTRILITAEGERVFASRLSGYRTIGAIVVLEQSSGGVKIAVETGLTEEQAERIVSALDRYFTAVSSSTILDIRDLVAAVTRTAPDDSYLSADAPNPRGQAFADMLLQEPTSTR